MSQLYQPGIDPNLYTSLLQQKKTQLAEMLAPFQPHDQPEVELECFASQPTHFRLRAEFRIWHEGDRCFYAMFEPGNKSKAYEVTDFPIASELINRLMPTLLDAINASELLKNRLFQCEFLTTLSGDALITLIYHKKLEEDWESEARALMDTLGFPIIGRSRKQKLVLERDYVTEQLEVDGKTYSYRQIEGGFTQPNGEMNRNMLSWARDCAVPANTPDNAIGGDLLELYCGNGNFSVALADRFDRVLATEISKTSVAAAQVNIQDNGINNLIIARLSSEEFVQALRGERTFERLRDVELSEYDFRTVLVDPPRAGLDEESVKQIQGYDHIIYISCNPETLGNNLEQLTETHDVQRLALFDQFPYTHHIETGVFLKRKAAN